MACTYKNKKERFRKTVKKTNNSNQTDGDKDILTIITDAAWLP